MAANNDYGQLFCEAVDTIVKQRLEQINFDTTSLCTITDDSEKDQGKYKVKVHNGLAEYTAYSASTDYSTGDNVYVQIPNSDMNEQKFIVAKKTDESGIPLSYKPPFASFVNITGNLVSNTNGVKAGLIANEEKSSDKPNAEEIVIWAYNSDAYADKSDYGVDICQYNKLGIQAQFSSWLGDLRVKSGSYGLKLRVEAEKEDAEDIENLPEEERIDNELLYYDFILDSTDMVGNPYDFGSYYQQEIVFDISDLSKIKRMELQFYQKKNFYNEKGNLIEVLADPNLFVKDVNICFGFDISEFDEDKVQIFSLNSPKYDTTADPPESNHKLLQLRWIHKDEDGNVYVVPDNDEELDFKILWYKYRLGTYSHTQKSGADWTPMSLQFSDYRFNLMIDDVAGDYPDQDTSRDDENFAKYMILDNEWIEYNQSAELGYYRQPSENKTWLIPDITLAEESIKAIISYCAEPGNENTRKYLVSNILSFTNREEVVSKPTVDAVTALTIVCDDSSNGNYMIYNQGGDILDNSQSSQEKTFTAYFKGAPLQNAEYIEWIIPTEASMLKIESNYLGAVFTTEIANKKEFKDKINNDIKDGLYHIFRFGNSLDKYNIEHANSQRYKIKSFYSPGYTNNTVQCKIVKDKITYTATKQLRFGPSGTSGSDHTLIIEFDEPNINAIEIGGTKTYYNLRARLYNYEGQEINFDDVNDYTLTWDWYKIDNKSTGDGFNALQNHYEDGNYVATGVPYRKALELNNNIDINELHILQVTLTWRGSQSLIAYFPIPLKAYIKSDDENKKYEYGYIQGPDKIVYQSNGNPYYMRSAYRIFKNTYEHRDENEQVDDPWVKIQTSEIDAEWSMIHSDDSVDNRLYPFLKKSVANNSPDLYTLEPLPLYIDGVPICGVQAKLDGEVIWTQPLLIIMNRYPNGAVNRWDGEGLKLDEKNGTIIGTAFAAGHKNPNNTFSGVMLGDWDKGAEGDVEDSVGVLTGVYGLHEGEVSYAFMEDGTAFIGKSGKGRIYLDGDEGKIYSGNYYLDEEQGIEAKDGMLIDLSNGHIDAYNFRLTSSSIYMDSATNTFEFDVAEGGHFAIEGSKKDLLYFSSADSYIQSNNFSSSSETGMKIDLDEGEITAYDFLLEAGSGNNKIVIDSDTSSFPLKIGSNFKVAWDGSLFAKNASLQGMIQSTEGLIGGWYVGTDTLEGGGNYVVTETDGKLSVTNNGSSKIILKSSEGSIAGGILKPLNSTKMQLWGDLAIYASGGGAEYGQLGYITSKLPGVDGDAAEGIGMSAGSYVSKVTKSNVGMSGTAGFLSIGASHAQLGFNSGTVVVGSTGSCGIEISSSKIKMYGGAEKQEGIYARFA